MMHLTNIPLGDIVDARDIKTQPHTKRYHGFSRRPSHSFERMYGYQIIKVSHPKLMTNSHSELTGVIRVGNYVVQPRYVYAAPQVYDTYADMIKDFYIPNNKDYRFDVKPSLEYYAEDYIDEINNYIQRWDAEVERSKQPRKRMRKIKVDLE